jgi:hypothetical protein
MKVRHDTVMTHFAQMLRTAGNVTRITGLSDVVQDRCLSTGKRLVPDAITLNWESDGRDTCFDLAITHPAAPSYVERAATNPLHAADAREKQKNNKYLSACSKEGMAFTPLVIESYGAIGTSAAATIKRAVSFMQAKLPDDFLSKLGVNTWTASSFHVHFLQRISISLQRSNAKMIQKRAARDFKIVGRPQAPASPPREAG